jgi:peptide/nickel transport system permease protein
LRNFILRRLILSIVTLFAMSIIVFGMARVSGDPRYMFIDDYATEEDWDILGKALGIDRPLFIQYGMWAGKILRGDLGRSFRESRPVSTLIAERFAATLQLAGTAFVFTLLIGVPMGVLSAVKRGTLWDSIGKGAAMLGQSMPTFWLGLILILLFSLWLDVLPAAGKGWLNVILPAFTLSWFFTAGILRLVRSAMLEVLDADYIRFARAKGVTGNAVVWKHALRNAMITPLSFAGILLAQLLTGSIVVEFVFAWPGLGQLSVRSITTNDFPTVQAVVLIFTALYVASAFLVDLTYGALDPRVRYG